MHPLPQPAPDPLGLYLSVPFCRAKCSFCNFASDVHPRSSLTPYVHRLIAELDQFPAHAASLNATLPTTVDTLYLGGGTPSLLPPHLIDLLFTAIHSRLHLLPEAEATLEAAPAQLSAESLLAFQRHGINRVSLGIQSFVDREARTAGRLHSPEEALAQIESLHSAGIPHIALDLILGLPHQTHASFLHSLHTALRSGADHISLYMLEVDEDSRLGREALANGSRYGAAELPPDEAVTDWYLEACEILAREGFPQYEISNFARPGCHSRHNLRYWLRRPYLGLGLDAHSMLPTPHPATPAIRWANPDTLSRYLPPTLPGLTPPFTHRTTDPITPAAALEETIFLTLRLNQGLHLPTLQCQFPPEFLNHLLPELHILQTESLLTLEDNHARLTPRGRTLSNEVFSRLLLPTPA